MTMIYKLDIGRPGPEKVAEYSLTPKEALVNFIEQFLKGNYQFWKYPEEIKGMRESSTAPGNWYYDTGDTVYAAYPV